MSEMAQKNKKHTNSSQTNNNSPNDRAAERNKQQRTNSPGRRTGGRSSCKINGDLRVLRRWNEEEDAAKLAVKSFGRADQSKMYVIFFFFFPSLHLSPKVSKWMYQANIILHFVRAHKLTASHPRQRAIYYINWKFRWIWASVTHLFFNWTQHGSEFEIEEKISFSFIKKKVSSKTPTMRAFVLLSCCLALAAARPEAGYSYNRPSNGGGHSSGGGGGHSSGGFSSAGASSFGGSGFGGGVLNVQNEQKKLKWLKGLKEALNDEQRVH